MKIIDMLKPKTKEEIDDLERRGFRKNAGRWRFNINITPYIMAYEEDEDVEAFRQSLLACLSEKPEDLRLFLSENEVKRFNDIVDEIRMMGQDPKVDEMDNMLSKLYDWADDNDVWIQSF